MSGATTMLFADSGDVTGVGNTGVQSFPFGISRRVRGRLVAEGLAGGDTLRMVLVVHWTGLAGDQSGGTLITTPIYNSASNPLFYDFLFTIDLGGRATYYQFHWNNVSGTVRAKAYGVFVQA